MIRHSINAKSLIQYGFIALPIAFAGYPIYVLVPDFYATHHNLSLTLLGVLFLAIRLFDAVQDPLIGFTTDKLRGRFLGFVAIAGAVLCLSIFGLFNYAFFTPAIWLTVCMFFAVSAYSVLTIILGAQATLWTDDRNDQTRIAGAREAFGLIGLIIAVSIPTLFSRLTDIDHVYLWYSGLLVVLMSVGVIGFSKIRLDMSLSKNALDKKTISILLAIRALPRQSLKLFTVYGMSMLASSIPAVLIVFYVRDRLEVQNLLGVFMFLYFFSAAIAMPLWKNISIRFSKYQAWLFAHILAVSGFVGAFFLSAGDLWPYAFVCIISGLALGADLTLPASILADDIHAHDNRNFSGTHYAFLAFIAKISLALASATILPPLDMSGFKPGVTNSATALIALSTAYALIPCLLKLIAALMLYVFFIRFQPGETHENAKVIDYDT